MLIDGRAPASAVPVEAHDASVLLVFNGWHEAIPFTLPRSDRGGWHLRCDTADPGAADAATEPFTDYVATGRSVLVFSTREAS